MLSEVVRVLEHVSFLVLIAAYGYHIYQRYQEKKYKKIYDHLLKFRDLHPRIAFLVDEVIRQEDLTKITLLDKKEVVKYIRTKAQSLNKPESRGAKNGLMAISDVIEKEL